MTPVAEPAAKKPETLTDALHVFVLTSFAFAQPLYNGLSAKATFLVDRSIRLPTVLIVVSVLSLAIPGLIVLTELAAGRFSEKVRRRLHQCLVFLLVIAIVLPVLTNLSGMICYVSIALTLVISALAVFAYSRYRVARHLVTAACPGVLLFPAVMLFAPASTNVFFPTPPRSKPAAVSVKNPVPVVVVVFDALNGASIRNSENQVDASRYPAFAELAKDATWFRNATAVHISTDNAVPAILTGNYPPPDRRPLVKEYPNNLFTLLLATERYKFVVFEPYTRLFPDKADTEIVEEVTSTAHQTSDLLKTLAVVYLHHLVPVDFPIDLPDIPKPWLGLQDDPLAETLRKRRGLVRHDWIHDRGMQGEHFLKCVAESEKPVLYFLHVVLPHVPLNYLPSGRHYETNKGSSIVLPGTVGWQADTWSHDDQAAVQGYQRYLLQVGFVDRFLSQLLDRLKETQLYDRCLLVVTADHGICFRPGQPRRSLSDENVADILPVPLFVKLPHQRQAKIVDRNVESIDILPTIADVLEIPLPWETDGWSLLDSKRAERKQKRLYNAGDPVILNGSYPAASKSLAYMLQNFKSDQGFEALFQIGPYNELVGKSVDTLSQGERSQLSMRLFSSGKRYDPTPGGLVPCFLKGEIISDSPAGGEVNVAVAINGTIQAVTQNYELAGLRSTWTALVPESALRVGDNDFDVYVLSSEAGKVTLHSCEITHSSF